MLLGHTDYKSENEAPDLKQHQKIYKSDDRRTADLALYYSKKLNSDGDRVSLSKIIKIREKNAANVDNNWNVGKSAVDMRYADRPRIWFLSFLLHHRRHQLHQHSASVPSSHEQTQTQLRIHIYIRIQPTNTQIHAHFRTHLLANRRTTTSKID